MKYSASFLFGWRMFLCIAFFLAASFPVAADDLHRMLRDVPIVRGEDSRISRGPREGTREYDEQRFRHFIALRANHIFDAYEGNGYDPWRLKIKIASSKAMKGMSDWGRYNSDTQIITFSLSEAREKFPEFALIMEYNPAEHTEKRSQFRDQRKKGDKEATMLLQMDVQLAFAYLRYEARKQESWLERSDCFSETGLYPIESLEGEALEKRWSCAMVLSGLMEHVDGAIPDVFHEQNPDVWPKNLFELASEGSIRKKQQRLIYSLTHGGDRLTRPIIRALGAREALKYMFKHPFRIEHGDVALSADAYQKEALRFASMVQAEARE